MAQPPYRFMNLVWGWCVERLPDDKREGWLIEMQAPLPGREKAAPTQIQAESEGADFMATMAMHTARSRG